jgi:hypothetical protein
MILNKASGKLKEFQLKIISFKIYLYITSEYFGIVIFNDPLFFTEKFNRGEKILNLGENVCI